MVLSSFLSNNRILSKIIERLVFLLVKFFRTINKISGIKTGNNVAVIAFHKIGDSVFTLPALKAINIFFKKDFYIFCFEETKPIFELFFNDRFIITFRHSDFLFNGRFAKGIIRKRLRELNPGIIFDFKGGTSTASLLFNSSVKQILGIWDEYYEYYKPVYSNYIPQRKKPHIMDIYLDVIKPVIPVLDKDLKKFETQVNKNGYILIHPFAGWKAKEWNFLRFITLAKKINRIQRTIIITDPGKINKELMNIIFQSEIEIIESSDLYKFIEITKECSMFISNDSGPVYIANMLGKPTFTIYGPTNPDFTLPVGSNHRFIRRTIKCSPKHNNQYCFTDAGRNGCPSFECMSLLEVDEVYNAIEAFISELGIKYAEKLDTSL